MIIASKSRSPQIAAAARLLALSWAFSLQLWILLDAPWRSYAFITLDLTLAACFFQMSRGKWFPAPLFFLHFALAVYHFYTLLAGSSIAWVGAYINRIFEVALLYVLVCASFRIYSLNTKKAVHKLP